MSLLSYQHEDQGYLTEGVAATPSSSDAPLALVPGAHVRLAAARALAGGMKENSQPSATSSPSSLSVADVVHKIQTLFLVNQPSSSTASKGVGNKPSTTTTSTTTSLGASKAPPSRGVPLTSNSGIGPAALGFAVTAKKPTSGGLGSLGAMMGGIGQPPKPKPKTATGLGLGGLGVGAVPPPAVRAGGGSSGLTPLSAQVPGLGLGLGGGGGAGAGAVTDPPSKIATRLAVAEWVRAVGEQQALPDESKEQGAATHPSLSLLAFVLAYGAVDHASEVCKTMLMMLLLSPTK